MLFERILSSRERWKTIKGFPRYKISSKGRVKSYWVDEENGRILSWKYGGLGKNKKPMIDLRANMKTYHLAINSLVTKHFIRNPKPKKYNCVSYKDGNPMNVNMNNLYWTNRSELTRKWFYKKYMTFSLADIRWIKYRSWEGDPKLNPLLRTAHGRAGMYQGHKCRCELCRKWKHDNDLKYKRPKWYLQGKVSERFKELVLKTSIS